MNQHRMNDELIQYFSMVLKGQAEGEQWRLGQKYATRFAELQANAADESAFHDLLKSIESLVENPGAGYFQLWSNVVSWGYHNRFSVPLEHPWQVDTRQLLCVNGASYAISVGSTYLPIDIDDTRQMVTIVDDRGRKNSFPLSCFARQVRPDRRWGRIGEPSAHHRFHGPE